MKPESQGPTETGKLQDKRLQINNEPRIKIGRNYIYDLSKAIVRSNKSESAKVRDPLTIQDRSTGGPRKGHGDYLRSKHYKSRTYSPDSPTRTGVYGSEVTRNPSLRKSATDKVKDRVSLNKGLSEARDNLLYRRIDKDNTKSIKEANQQVRRNVTYRTPGKQRMLSGGKASGMSYIFKEMKRRLMKGTPGSHNKTY
jgi:hypothetical protein